MFFCIMGTNSLLFDWVKNIFSYICSVSSIYCDVASVDTIDGLRAAIKERTKPNFLLFCVSPSQNIIDLLCKNNCSMLIVSEDPYCNIEHFTKAHQQDLTSALRQYIKALCLLRKALVRTEIKLLDRATLEMDIYDFVKNLFDLFQIETSSENISEVVKLVEGDTFQTSEHVTASEVFLNTVSGASLSGTYIEGLNEIDRNLLIETVDSYQPLLRRESLTTIVWRRQIFYSHDISRGSRNFQLDLTGRARYLIFGPYLYLPEGRWIAQIRFAVDGIKSGCTLVADVYNGETLAFGEIAEVPQRGIFTFELAFTVIDASLPLEIRIVMKYGSIEGYFMFGDVDLRLDNQSADNSTLGSSNTVDPSLSI